MKFGVEFQPEKSGKDEKRMKIVFICGSLEPGKDGVGDYCIQLAEQLNKNDHSITLFGVNDKFVPSIVIDNTVISSIRLPSSLTIKLRLNYLKSWLKLNKTDFISLQFVPYSYNTKGLPLLFIRNLFSLCTTAKWNIMFHELWIQTDKNSNIKTRIIARLQRSLIKVLINKLQPVSITTSIPLYKRMLSDERVEILPLFSNIPIYRTEVFAKEENLLRAVHFGSFSSALSEMKVQFNFLKNVGIKLNKRVLLTCIGEGSKFKGQSIQLAKTMFGKNNVVELGRLSEKDISEIIQNSDIGVSRANIEFAGKSGSTLAMLEHGLPVILRGSEKEMNLATASVLYFRAQLFFADSDESRLIKKQHPKSKLPEVAEMFTSYLTL